MPRRGWRRAVVSWLILVALAAAADRALKSFYYSRTYRYYDAGEVYWEDSHTLLLFSPDRRLFWRLKPRIRMRLQETPEQYGPYVIGARKAPYAFEVVTDSHGYNSPEFDCGHKGGTFRIVTLGDSRTMAEGVRFEDLYPRRLEALLRARHPDRSYEVINAGVSGYSSHQGLVALEGELLPCAPDLVTVLFGINDQDVDQGISDADKGRLFDTPLTTLRAWSNRSMLVYFLRREAWQLRATLFGRTPARPVDYAGSGPHAPRVALDDYARNLERIADLGRGAGFRPVFLILPTSAYAYSAELFPDQAALGAAERRELDDIEPLVARDPAAAEAVLRRRLAQHPECSRARHLLARSLQGLGRFEEAHESFVTASRSAVFGRYEAVVRRVAAERNVTLVDLTPEFTTLRREPLYLDDMHPSRLGHEVIARRLYQELVETALVP